MADDNTILYDRQMLVAKYEHGYEFKIPKGIDLNDKNIVEHWDVRLDAHELHITLANGKELIIEGNEFVEDWTHPEYEVVDGCDWDDTDEEEIAED